MNLERLARTAVCLFVAGSLVAAVAARGENLRDFLQSVERTIEPEAPVRGDGSIEISNNGSIRRDKIAIVLRPPGDVYVELHEIATRALLFDDGAQALLSVKGGGSEEFKSDAPLADSDFTREDLQPFRVAHFSDMRISDESGGELTAALFPVKSQYSLLAMTFEREKKVPIKTIFYRDTLNNAVKIARYGGYQQVAGKWLPTTVSVESFRLKSRTTLTLRWTINPTLPAGLFDAGSLAKPSQLDWPTASASSGP